MSPQSKTINIPSIQFQLNSNAARSNERTVVRVRLLPIRNFSNFVNPTLPVSFGRNTKNRWSLDSSLSVTGKVKDPTQEVNV